MRFPLFTLIAPVVSSVILWLVTGSPVVLLFAAMGPLMAAANYLDARRTSKAQQATRAESERLAEAQAEHTRRQGKQDALAEALAAHPAISSVVEAGELVRPPWCMEMQPGPDRVIRVGVEASSGHPIAIDAAHGIALLGSGVVAASASRSVRTALHWGWGSSGEVCEQLDELVKTYSSYGMIPPRIRWVIDVSGDGTAGVTDVASPTSLPRRIHVDVLTRVEAELIEAKLAQSRGHVNAPEGTAIEVADLDLARNGPHAVVAGTTGSGKTEFLVAWLVAMLEQHSPRDLNILVLDFKGGLGFARLAALPQVVGIVTDLTPALAQRVLQSLRAEIRYREGVLASHGVADVTQLSGGVLSRLVIVADEYRTLLEATPEAAAVFVDLTSRGRALGIHVILTTQHTGGVLADAILANCAMRVCFRVTNSHDSRTLIGDDRATQLPHQPGRAVVVGNQLPVQHLTVTAMDAQRLSMAIDAAQEWVAAHPEHRIRRPWLDPLPSVLAWHQLPMSHESAGSTTTPGSTLELTFGLTDDPDNQAQPVAQWRPLTDGHLLITGAPGSGRSTSLAALAHAASTAGIPTTCAVDAQTAWDLVMEPPTQGCVLLDNLDSVAAEFSHEHRDAFFHALQALLREGAGRGIFVVATTLAHGAAFAQVQNLMRAQLHLGAVVGAGQWRGLPTRIAVTPAQAAASAIAAVLAPAPPISWDHTQSYLVVTHRPERFIARLPNMAASRARAIGPGATRCAEPSIYVGDIDDWQAAYTLLVALRRTAHIVFDECTPSEVRSLRLSRGLLPYAPPGTSIVLSPSGKTRRVRIGVD